MKRLAPPLLLACFVVLALTPASTPAQQGPAKPAPLLLTTAEVKLWQAWIRGDNAACYAQAQDMLADPGFDGDATIVAALQSRCADDLGWHAAHARDVQTALDAAGNAPALRWQYMQRLRHTGNLDLVREQAAGLGFLNTWWVAGPFGNERGQGFEDTLEPENDLRLDAVYSGMNGQQVTWRELPATSPDGAIPMGAILRPNKEAAAYLLTAVYCDKQVQVQLGVASDGPVKVWQPGTYWQDEHGSRHDPETSAGLLVLEADVERPYLLDQNDGWLHLIPGWNPLLVKTGNSDADWKLSLRLHSGQPTRLPKDSAEMQQVLAAAKPRLRQIDLAETPNYQPPSPLHAVMSELLHPVRDRVTSFPRLEMAGVLSDYEARLTDATGATRQTLAPERAVLHYIAAWANRSSAQVAAGREENRRRELLKQCLALDPLAARAALELGQYYTSTFANPAMADQYASLAAKLQPAWVEARLFAARVLQMKGLGIETERELARLTREFPDHPGVLRYAAYYAGMREDYQASNQLFERTLAADYADDYARDRLLERAVKRGDVPAALKYATETRKLDPFDTHAATQMATLFASQGKYSLAERELAGALKIAPRDDDLLAQSGEVLALWATTETGPKQADLNTRSLDRYRAAIDANPNREDLLRYLEFMDRQRPKFEAALQQDITSRIQQALTQPMNSEDPWAVVYRDQITVVHEDGTESFYTQEARRVQNDDGRDALQQMRAPAWGDQQARCVEARIWHPDGSMEEGRRSAYGATFPSLEVGDIVQVRFRVTDLSQSFFGDFFGTREVLGDFVPVNELRLVYVLPPGREFYEYRTLGAPARVETMVEDHRVWTYTATALAKLADEPLAPPAVQRAATVQISTYKSWQDFGRWYYNLIRKQLEPTPEMAAKVAELCLGAKTERDKARAIYEWVVTAVRYNADWHFGVHGYKPFSAGAVFARCIGDCKDKAILICALLNIAGIKAWPVITNLEAMRGQEDITLPMPGHFNHAIALIEFRDGTSQFVDGTATYNGFDELPAADAGASVIVVRPEGGQRTSVPTPEPDADTLHDEVSAEILDSGAMRLTVTRTGKGDSASGVRAAYQREGDRKRQLEQEWSEHYPGATVSDITVSDLASLRVEPWIKFTVELPAAVESKAGDTSFRVAPDPQKWGQSQFASLGARKTDLLLPAPYTRSSTWTMALGAGLVAKGLPDDLRLETPNIRVAVSASVKDGKLVVRREYAILGHTVKAAEYANWRRTLLAFDRAESATITLRKGN
ncbi:MAG: DUF3857 domain-containing protein [Planctomycetes bacterium]|nr:DUF3857 domain-containing protein [Planctomycetota bacterium]